jgi:cob(I)alamin adenosyltransferase
MVRLSRIYTRAGDGGRTRLVDGSEVAKADPRVVAFGAVDELNATLGLARGEVEGLEPLARSLSRIQNDLFDLGADLATPYSPAEDDGGPPALRIVAAQVTRLEREIDALNAELAPLNSFVLPGGSRAATWLHLARTVCRRAERDAVAFLALEGGGDGTSVPRAHGEALRYLNRLSDYLFVAARWANDQGARDVLWVPGAHRDA